MNKFSLEEYVRREGLSLAEYALGVAARNDCRVCENDIQELVDHFPGFDEEHLVFGIEICGAHGTPLQLAAIVRYLEHPLLAVFCAAERNLRNSARSQHSEVLFQLIEQVSVPDQDRLAAVEDLRRTLAKAG